MSGATSLPSLVRLPLFPPLYLAVPLSRGPLEPTSRIAPLIS